MNPHWFWRWLGPAFRSLITRTLSLLPVCALLSSAQCHPQQVPAFDGKYTHGEFQAFITLIDCNCQKRPRCPLVPISVTENELWFILLGSSANLCTSCCTHENKYADRPTWVTDFPLSRRKYGLTIDSLVPVTGMGSLEAVLQKKARRRVWMSTTFNPVVVELPSSERGSQSDLRNQNQRTVSQWESSHLCDNPEFLKSLHLAFPPVVVFPMQTYFMKSGFSPFLYSQDSHKIGTIIILIVRNQITERAGTLPMGTELVVGQGFPVLSLL